MASWSLLTVIPRSDAIISEAGTGMEAGVGKRDMVIVSENGCDESENWTGEPG